MTYSLPFGLKQKPLNHYLEGGVIKFSCREGNLYYTIKKITKTTSATVLKGRVYSEYQLAGMLSIKSINDIHTLEVVN